MTNGWRLAHYRLFRALLGTYLAVHFGQLVPWGAELFSSQGALGDANASPLAHAFPNVLAVFDPPWFVTGLLAAATMASLLFAAGVRDRPLALGLWYVWACLLGRNPLIQNPGLPYVGWMLLAHAALPAASNGWWPRDRPAPDRAWRMPGSVHAVAWVLMSVGYSYSGLTKLGSPSWLDGTAIVQILGNPLARLGVARDLLLDLPDLVLRALTWGVLALELAFAPLALAGRLRPWLWSAMLAVHLSLLAVLDFADLSLAMILLHAFTFDPDWLQGAMSLRGKTAIPACRSLPAPGRAGA